MNQECAERNEQNIVTVHGEGMEIVFKQIAGLIARRIVFNHSVGDRVERGQRVGLISSVRARISSCPPRRRFA